MGLKLKEKDSKLLKLKEINKELRKINRNSSVQDKNALKEEIDDVKIQLNQRDNDLKVTDINYIHKGSLIWQKEILKKQEDLEKNHRRQLLTEIKKKQALKKQLQSASEMIYALEKTIKVIQLT